MSRKGKMKHKTIIGIDPGPKESAYVLLCGTEIIKANYVPNDVMIHVVQDTDYDMLAVEGIRYQGSKKVGNDVFRTCELAGIFYQAARSRGKKAQILFRTKNNDQGTKSIRAYITGDNSCERRAIDSVVKSMFRDYWGGIKNPGILQIPGGKNHKLSAIAVALTYQGCREYLESIGKSQALPDK